MRAILRGSRTADPAVWAFRNDGDLWFIVAMIVLQRGAGSVAISKAKGHATEEHVRCGLVTSE
eukprot:538504-Alexandrium_andersonii.AAC.1